MFYHCINRYYLNLARKADDFVFQAAAVYVEGGILTTEHRDVLVHNAARQTNEARLGALAKLGQPEWSDFPAAKQRKRRRDFERRRGAESGAFGHRATHEQPFRLDGVTCADEFLRHADYVVGPIVRRSQLRQVSNGPSPQLVFSLGVDAQITVLGIGCCNETGKIERDRQHEAEVVIGMLANQIHAARRAKDAHVLAAAELMLKAVGDHERLRANSNITPPNAIITMPQ